MRNEAVVSGTRETVDESSDNGRSSWGNAFVMTGTKWKCEVCMVSNEDSLRKCAACEAVRPGSVGEESQTASKSGTMNSQSVNALISSLWDSARSIGIGKGGFIFSAANVPSSTASAVSDESKVVKDSNWALSGFGSSTPSFKSPVFPAFFLRLSDSSCTLHSWKKGFLCNRKATQTV